VQNETITVGVTCVSVLLNEQSRDRELGVPRTHQMFLPVKQIECLVPIKCSC